MTPTAPYVWVMLCLIHGATGLHIVFGAHNVPHPAKADKGGEDAFFFDDRLGIFGIADGVGGSARGQVDPGVFSREVLQRCHLSASTGSGSRVPNLKEALQTATEFPISLGGSTTLLLGELQSGSETLKLLNLGDSGAMVLRPALREFGDSHVLFPRCVLRSQYQEHGFNYPYQASAKNFDSFIDELDVISVDLKEGDVLIAATDGVLDNLFDLDLQACVSEHVKVLHGEDPAAAQASIDRLAESISLRANAIGMQFDDRSIKTPFWQAASQEGRDYKGGGKLDDVAIVCGVVRHGERPGLRMAHNFDGADASILHLSPPGARGVVSPTGQGDLRQPHSPLTPGAQSQPPMNQGNSLEAEAQELLRNAQLSAPSQPQSQYERPFAPPGQYNQQPPSQQMPPGQSRDQPPRQQMPPGPFNQQPPSQQVPPGQSGDQPPRQQMPPGPLNKQPWHEQAPAGQTRDQAPRRQMPPGLFNQQPPRQQMPPGQFNQQPPEPRQQEKPHGQYNRQSPPPQVPHAHGIKPTTPSRPRRALEVRQERTSDFGQAEAGMMGDFRFGSGRLPDGGGFGTSVVGFRGGKHIQDESREAVMDTEVVTAGKPEPHSRPHSQADATAEAQRSRSFTYNRTPGMGD